MNDNMLFTRNVSLDEKGRMFFIGRYTGVEPGEKLYLFYSEERDSVIVRSEKSIKNIKNKYIDLSPGEREKKLEELGDFFLNSIGITQVDKSGRVSLGINVCAELGLFESVFVVGCFDEIRIYPNKEVYLESLKAKRASKLKQLEAK